MNEDNERERRVEEVEQKAGRISKEEVQKALKRMKKGRWS